MSSPTVAARYTLYVGGIGNDADATSLRALFETFGSVVAVRVARDVRNARCRGFGYVTFGDPRPAIEAQLALDGQSLGLQRLRVAPAL